MNPSSEYIARKLKAGHNPNRLINEKSPYLLQHAFNPVDWHPWGEEAFAKARRENKPIFLSIGYSTCHWCHVMERESFENPDIAQIMNEYFVCIKVDREERPDVDKVYMTAVQAMTGSGGWPMSVWLTPNLQPFFAGTYFPPDSRYGRPGFPDLLKRLHATWMEQREQVLQSGEQIIKVLQEHTAVSVAPDTAL
ncbi:MAG: thioredoxin domain-containing protein, partial [bacterium]